MGISTISNPIINILLIKTLIEDTFNLFTTTNVLLRGCNGISITKYPQDIADNIDNISSFSGNASKELKEGENLAVCSSGSHASLNNTPTLAFPSISTSYFQFNLEKASDIIVEVVEEYVNKLGSARLVLVDVSHKSKILSLVKTKAAQKNIELNKFFTFVGDITKLYSEGGLRCNVIANAANW